MKVLCFHDSPTLSSGFARVAQNLLRRWRAAGIDIDVWGIGFVGWGYRRVPYADTLFPGGGPGEWASPQRLGLFLAQLETGNYTHVWLMQDTFMLSTGDFPARLREVCNKRKIRSMLYFPVDAALDPEWTDIIAAVDVPVAYTYFGKAEAEAKGRERGHEFTCKVLPHGVDTDVYHVLPDRARLRATLWDKPWVGPDDFLMLNVNANQRRKDVSRSLEILAGLRRRGVPAKLLMHMPESSYEGLSLEAVGRQLGLTVLNEWAHHGAFFRNGNALVPETDLLKFYNVADLYLTTTLGEGWGLGITEALACGCPVALPRHTACGEIYDRVGVLDISEDDRMVALSSESHGVVLDGDNSRVRHRVSVSDAVATLYEYYNSGKWRQRPASLPDPLETWLSWDRIAAEMLRMLKRPDAAKRRGQTYYMEVGGGLGDVFNQLYHRGAYNVLRDLQPGERAKVVILSHNPFVRELFDYHHKAAQLDIHDLGYWHGAEVDRENRRKHNLPPPGANSRLPEKDASLEFYPTAQDEAFLARLPKGYVVLSASAGLPERDLPASQVAQIIDALVNEGIPIVNTGRTYQRHGRSEKRLVEKGVIDAVDLLTVPGTARLLQASLGLVTCHSALNILAWRLRKPQLLLYPFSVFQQHIANRDEWAFGIDYPETVHACFQEFSHSLMLQFLQQIGAAHQPTA